MNWIPTQEKVDVGGRVNINKDMQRMRGDKGRIDVARIFVESEEQLK